MSESLLRFEEISGVGVLTFHRPEKLNALNLPLLTELKAFLPGLAKKNLVGLIVTGAGEKAFVAGADIAGMSKLSPLEALDFGRLGQQVTILLESLPFPTIAAVHGFALGGGCEMALACDFIYASEKAVFGLPEVKLGLIPGFGGTQRLARRVGSALAKEMIFSGRNMSAAEAVNAGLVNTVFPDQAALMAGCHNYFTLVASNSARAVSRAKLALTQGMETTIEQGLALEADAFAGLFAGHDALEGMTAFLEKRKANFKGE